MGPTTEEALIQACEDTWLRGGADALILSGRGTGQARAVEDFARVRAAIDAPLLCGSGLDLRNAQAILEHTDGAIVGTALKREGKLSELVDEDRVRAFAEVFRR